MTAVVTAGVLNGAGLSQPAATNIAIGKMDVGAPPAEFEFARTGQGAQGQWTVVRDAGAPAGRAIEQSSADRTDYRFPLAIYKPLSAQNVDVTVRFKPIAGRTDRAGGVAVRLIDAENYYVARANALEDNVNLYRVVKGRREQVAGTKAKVIANQWHTLALKAEGDRFTVSFDGKLVLTAADRSITGAGKIALWTKADSVTRFDRIEIATLP